MTGTAPLICGNCGFHNQPGDAFCGNCRRYLEFTADEGAGADAAAGGIAAAGDSPATDVPAPPTTPTDTATTTTGTTTAAPLTGPGGATPTQTGQPWSTQPGLVRCPRCGIANELTRPLCMNCSLPLPRSGVARGRLDGTGTRNDNRMMWIIGGVGILTVLALGAIVVFGGFLGGPAGPGGSGSPGRSDPVAVRPTGGASLQPGATTALSSVVVASSALPVDPGLPTAHPGVPSTDPGAPTSAPGTATAAPATPTSIPGDPISCEPRTFSAAAPGRWSVTEMTWPRRDSYDVLALSLVPQAASADTASVTATLVQRNEVQRNTGIDAPTQGDIVLVLDFNNQVTSVGNITGFPGRRALKEALVRRLTRQHVLVLIGIAGQGCFNVRTEAWSGDQPIELFVEIRR